MAEIDLPDADRNPDRLESPPRARSQEVWRQVTLQAPKGRTSGSSIFFQSRWPTTWRILRTKFIPAQALATLKCVKETEKETSIIFPIGVHSGGGHACMPLPLDQPSSMWPRVELGSGCALPNTKRAPGVFMDRQRSYGNPKPGDGFHGQCSEQAKY
ncbi:hypothetical protein OG21DRAFT_611052 [Imleria badia]|nr:hypothetical protein OG21DRAFT_611052 [Imleria badia]